MTTNSLEAEGYEIAMYRGFNQEGNRVMITWKSPVSETVVTATVNGQSGTTSYSNAERKSGTVYWDGIPAGNHTFEWRPGSKAGTTISIEGRIYPQSTPSPYTVSVPSTAKVNEEFEVTWTGVAGEDPRSLVLYKEDGSIAVSAAFGSSYIHSQSFSDLGAAGRTKWSIPVAGKWRVQFQVTGGESLSDVITVS